MQRKLRIGLTLFTAFVVWTILVRFVDVQPVGPQESVVGLASCNRFFHTLTGVHMTLYGITDWLSLIPIAFIMGFALLGLIQWIKRKHLLKVDRSILMLGVFYIVVLAAYILFEFVVINYRPVLINGILEPSYPSSTTMLVTCVMLTAIPQFNTQIKNRICRKCVSFLIIFFTGFMVIGRLISGVHWITDIIGGILLSTGLVLLYDYFNMKS